ncbi:MAG: DUF4160 domain-containing protein [Pseudomonadota bacterium]
MPARRFFFSREESRRHVHVLSGQGEAKFRLEPRISLARNHGLSAAHKPHSTHRRGTLR